MRWLLKAAPVEEPYRVVVTFVEPAREQDGSDRVARFWDSFGAWQDDRPIEDTLRDVHDAVQAVFHCGGQARSCGSGT